MRRRRLGNDSERRRIAALLKKKNAGWQQTRLMVLKMAMNSENTTAFICDSTGVSVPTISRWLAAYRSGGLEQVLERGTKHNHRPRKIDQEVVAFEFLAPCMRKGTRPGLSRSNATSLAS